MIKFLTLFMLIMSFQLSLADEVTPLSILISDEGISIDGFEVRKDNLYKSLTKELLEKGRGTPVVVIANSSSTFQQILDVKGLIQAVGFSKINLYVLSKDKLKSIEFFLGTTAIPSSKLGL